MDFTSKIKGLFNTLKTEGVLGTIEFLAAYFIDFFFDFRYGTDTRVWIQLEELNDIDSENKNKGFKYQPTPTVPVKKLFKKLELPVDKMLVDFGCGKGRVLLVAAQYGFKEVHGVEFSKSLAAVARKNTEVFKQKAVKDAMFKVFCEDAAGYMIKNEESIFFFFNPFGTEILEKVAENIKRSVQNHPRKIWVIYQNPYYRQVFDNDPFFRNFMEWKYLSFKSVVYTNEKI